MKAEDRVTGTFNWTELLMRYAYWHAQQQAPPTVEAIRQRFNVSRATAYRWRSAAHRAKGVTP